MVTAEFQTFLVASVAASSALIGLLFVSVSVAPERVFGPQSEAARQARAVSAFTALANIFFFSLTSLIPGINAGLVAMITGFVAFLQTLGLLRLVNEWRSEGALVRSLILFAGSAAIYGSEIFVGYGLLVKPSATGALAGLFELTLGAYAIGLGRAWELLGAPRSGLISSTIESIAGRFERKPKL
ncbi:MAG TPA: hypothetical protein VFR33_15600 [Candidatus Dormibacteraeota bacterium]|nr:hypothetical protein [Candidatus Dormibacteraeota bacterium]